MKPSGKGKGKYGLTPYQGRKPCFGFYNCSACEKGWTSAYSWANTSQSCKECKAAVYPYRQDKHKCRNGTKHKDDKHVQELCGKCKNKKIGCNIVRLIVSHDKT